MNKTEESKSEIINILMSGCYKDEIQQYVDEVSRRAFNDARVYIGYQQAQYMYQTFDEWKSRQ